MLNGVGTEADPVVAAKLFYQAACEFEWVLSDADAREIMEDPFHGYEDYAEAYEITKRLLEEARETCANFDEYEVMVAHDGETDEWEIYMKWWDKKPLYIKRYQVSY